MGKEIGAMLAKEHEDAGVKVISNENVKEVVSDSEGNVVGLKLDSDRVIDTSLVVFGKGVKPAT